MPSMQTSSPNALEESGLSPRELLAQCRPLSDPVMFLSRLLFWSIILGSLLVCLMFARQISPLHATAFERSAVVTVLVISLGVGLSAPIAMWLLVRQPSKNTVLYLRAFRSDAQAIPLRRGLKAAFGSRYRICGIRPPRHRVSWLWRILFSLATAYRY